MIETFKVDQVNNVLEAINNPLRYKLVKILRKEQGNINVTELSNQTEQSVVTVGNNLSKLTKVGLIKLAKSRDQRNSYFIVNESKVNKVLDVVDKDFNIFYKSFLLKNETVSRILAAINTESLSLVEIDKVAKVSHTNNTGLAYKYLKQLIEADLVTRIVVDDKIVYRTKGVELIKTVKLLKSI